MIKKIFSAMAAAAVMLLAAACGSKTDTAPADSGKIQVYTSFYAMYDFARMLGGDKADIYNMCPAGTEPHDYEPTAQDMAKLSKANVFIYNGLGMEAWTQSAMNVLDSDAVITVEASKNVPNMAENYDPHVWLDPENAYVQMCEIAAAFIEADPSNEAYYTDRLNECKSRTDALIEDYRVELNNAKSSTIVTSHEAYFSMCNAFGLTQLAVNGVNNSDEPTPTRVAEVEEFIKTNEIRYIFTEPLNSGTVMNAIASDTGCAVLVLDPFEGSAEEKDYFTVMYENLDALKTALN